MPWTVPKDWNVGDALTAEEMDKISANLNALKSPPEGVYNVDEAAGDLALTSTTWADVDGTAGKFSHTITTHGGRVLVTALIPCSIATVIAYFRILIDGADQTPNAADGLARSQGGSTGQLIAFSWWSPVLSAGSHTIKLQYKLSAAATLTIYRGAGGAGGDLIGQFAVREVS